MFDMYLASVLIYTIVIGDLVCIFTDDIKKNNWLDGVNPGNNKSRFIGTVIISAVPFLRLGVVGMIIYMSMHTKECHEQWLKKLQEEDY